MWLTLLSWWLGYSSSLWVKADYTFTELFLTADDLNDVKIIKCHFNWLIFILISCKELLRRELQLKFDLMFLISAGCLTPLKKVKLKHILKKESSNRLIILCVCVCVSDDQRGAESNSRWVCYSILSSLCSFTNQSVDCEHFLFRPFWLFCSLFVKNDLTCGWNTMFLMF